MAGKNSESIKTRIETIQKSLMIFLHIPQVVKVVYPLKQGLRPKQISYFKFFF